MDIFSQTALEICEGQQWDMEFETRNDVTVPEYMEMISFKDIGTFVCCVKNWCCIRGASEDDARKLYDFGIKWDWHSSYRMIIWMCMGFESVWKNIGGDILCNKKTFMLINALALADGIQRKELEKWIASTAFCPEEKIKAVTALYDKIGIGEFVKKRLTLIMSRGFRCWKVWLCLLKEKKS